MMSPGDEDLPRSSASADSVGSPAGSMTQTDAGGRERLYEVGERGGASGPSATTASMSLLPARLPDDPMASADQARRHVSAHPAQTHHP